jgi:long-chain acyl-CoA synthetase
MATSTAPEAFTRTTSTIPALFLERIGKTPDREAYRYPVGDEWRSLTWKAAGARVKALAAGLLSLGLGREDRVGILANTRYEWVLIDLGILCAGGATTTVYPSSTAEECAYILDDSASRFVFAEDAGQVAKLRGQKAAMPKLTKVILLDGAAEPGDAGWVMTLAELEAAGAAHLAATPTAVDDATAGVTREHLATLIYTSGTTGKPKGVRLMHDCWAYEADAIAELGFLSDRRRPVPVAAAVAQLRQGARVGPAQDRPHRGDRRPHRQADRQPRGGEADLRGGGAAHLREGLQQGRRGRRTPAASSGRIFQWAIGVGKQVSSGAPGGREPAGLLAFEVRIATKLVFSKLQQRFGGRLKLLRVGLGAAVARDGRVLPRRGHATSSRATGSPSRARPASSTARQGLQVRHRRPPDAGHRGQDRRRRRDPHQGPGHHARLPQPARSETAATLDADGWLTPATSARSTATASCKITDRKKDLIKTSGGKYVAPQYIEGKIKAFCPSSVAGAGARQQPQLLHKALLTLDARPRRPRRSTRPAAQRCAGRWRWR